MNNPAPDMLRGVQISRAAEILRKGGLVAFATETVYGLGADARNADAVAKIFRVKRRPPTNPLICHVGNIAAARQVVRAWPKPAQQLAERFWPGALTLVLAKTDQIPSIVTAGLDTVGVRVPAHPMALELLAAFGGPIAAPSANRSQRISPTTAEHVRHDLGKEVDLILDGGPCTVGIESTVLSLAGERPTILRPGGVSRQQIEAVIGPVEMAARQIAQDEPSPSPGQQAVHYAPLTPTFFYETAQMAAAERRLAEQPLAIHLVMPPDPVASAAGLYASLRAADARGANQILIRLPPDEPAWAAVRDRIMRAGKPLC
jgi:L-threonylcarbamoyladenylate synthase